VQPLYIDIDLYVRLAASGAAAKMQRYRVETEFYVASDPVIAAARAIQRCTPPAQTQIDAALAGGANLGGYGHSVALGIQRLREASAFWRGEVETTPDLKQSVRWKPGQGYGRSIPSLVYRCAGKASDVAAWHVRDLRGNASPLLACTTCGIQARGAKITGFSLRLSPSLQ
jgi:hypothetical protein